MTMNSFFIIYKGGKGIGLDDLSTEISLLISMSVGLLSGSSIIPFIPKMKQRIINKLNKKEPEIQQCIDDNNCEWIEDIESGSCENLSQNQCDSISQCSWEYGCIQWGWWYNWCYTYGYECMGGTFQFDNGYCQEVSIE